jgi:hypothetical protein
LVGAFEAVEGGEREGVVGSVGEVGLLVGAVVQVPAVDLLGSS